MRQLALSIAALLLAAAPAGAQTPTVLSGGEAHSPTPEVEVFGGYSYLRLYGFNNNGGIGAVTVNANSWLGYTGEVSGYVAEDPFDNNGLVVGGPKFTYRRGAVTPFVHLMAGGAFGGSDAAGAFVVGGGVDAKISKHVAIRLIQADYVATTFRSNNGRFSAGIVFRFGER